MEAAMQGISDVANHLGRPDRSPVSRVIIVSLSAQGLEPPGGFEPTLQQNLGTVAADRDLALFAFAPGEYALLAGPDADAVTDVRAAVLRTLNRHMTGSFGGMDLSRLVEPFDLQGREQRALDIVRRHLSVLEGRAAGRLPSGRLGLEHLEKLEDARRRLGLPVLTKRLVKAERIMILHPGAAPRPAFVEYMVDMDLLRREVLGANIDLRRNRPLFRRLTAMLDKLVLLSFDHLNPARDRCSLNLSLESIFTPEFEYFMNVGVGGDLARVVIELRAADVLEHFNEFLVARDYLARRGAVIAIDALFPKLLEALNLPQLGIRLGKLYATEDDFAALGRCRDIIAGLQQRGVTLILGRTPDEAAYRVALDVGIRLFQGPYVDSILGRVPEPA